MSSSKIESLQLARALAAILVVCVHVAGAFNYRFQYSTGLTLFKSGFAGVDIFFVLSGFIIYYTNASYANQGGGGQFFLKRLIRILPIFWISYAAFIGLFGLGKYVLHLDSGNSMSTGIVEHAGFWSIIATAFLIPNELQSHHVSWTLTFEMSFYALFAIVFFKRSKLFLGVLIGWVLACYLNVFFWGINVSAHLTEEPWRAFLNPMVAEFLLGCLVAKSVIHRRSYFPRMMLFLGIFLFALSATFIDYNTISQAKTVLFFGIPSALGIYGAAFLNPRVPKIGVYLGDASYSIYLFHVLFLSMLMKAAGVLKLSPYLGHGVIFVLFAVLVVMLCLPIHTYVEKPLTAWCYKKVSAKR